MSPFRVRFAAGVLSLLLGGMLCWTVPVLAQVPRVLHYQATLTDSDFPVEGPVVLTAAFYADATGGTPLLGWEEAWRDVPVTEGRVSLLLGSQTPLPNGLFDVPSLYLQITVNDEVLPRLQVASTAYALRAGLADGVTPGSISAPALATGAVTASALAGEAITTDALSEGSVTTPILNDAAVTAAKLAPGAVSTGALAEGAVTSGKLGPSAVAAPALAAGAVTTDKLANGAVTAEKVATGELVSSLNDLTDGVRLVAGENVRITSDADAGTITIEAGDDDFPSSRRWKTNVRSLDGLTLVRELRGVRYDWIESGTADVGLIAEEVGAVVPEVVTYAPNGVDAESVTYAKLVAVLIEAVKDQQRQIEADRRRLQDLQRRLDALEQASEE